MDQLTYSQQKELVEEVLCIDNDFLFIHRSELNIFKYTSLFTAFVFTFQIVILIIQNFTEFAFFSYSQILLLAYAFVSIEIILILYKGFTSAVRNSLNSKGLHLRYFHCTKCDFISFSNTASTLHLVVNPTHLLGYELLLVKHSEIEPSSIRFSVIYNKERKRVEVLNDPDFSVHSESERRIEMEISNWSDSLKNLSVYVAIGSVILGVIIFNFFLPLTLAIVLVILIVGSVMFASWILASSSENGTRDKVLLLKVMLEYNEKSRHQQIIFNTFTVGIMYWEHVKKGEEFESIDTELGPLYLIDKAVLNKFGELIEAIPMKR